MCNFDYLYIKWILDLGSRSRSAVNMIVLILDALKIDVKKLRCYRLYLVSSLCNYPETVRELCISTKFPHQEIRWNYGISRSVKDHVRNFPNFYN